MRSCTKRHPVSGANCVLPFGHADEHETANKNAWLVEHEEAVNHPAHYGGEDNPYEAIKVINAWGLGFELGSVLKYICRAEQKGATIQDLEKAAWYLQHEIEKRKAAEQ